MTTKLTNRDKVLLAVLIVFLVIAGFVVFIILPAIDKRSDLQQQIEQAETERSEMEAEIALLPSYQKRKEENESKRRELIQDLYPMMENQEIDKMITNMILDMGLMARDFTVSVRPENRNFTPYTASAMGLEEALTQEKGSQSSEKDTAGNEIYISDITVTAIGSLESLQTLIDSVTNEYPALRVVSYTIGDKDALILDRDQNVRTDSTLTISLEMYMCSK